MAGLVPAIHVFVTLGSEDVASGPEVDSAG
jgi:hypothetical protein